MHEKKYYDEKILIFRLIEVMTENLNVMYPEPAPILEVLQIR